MSDKRENENSTIGRWHRDADNIQSRFFLVVRFVASAARLPATYTKQGAVDLEIGEL